MRNENTCEGKTKKILWKVNVGEKIVKIFVACDNQIE
jgi:hypothetical protein